MSFLICVSTISEYTTIIISFYRFLIFHVDYLGYNNLPHSTTLATVLLTLRLVVQCSQLIYHFFAVLVHTFVYFLYLP